MNKLQSFEEYITSQSQIIIADRFVLNLILAAILGYILNLIYIKFGRSLSNKKDFANNFITISLTTTFIISIVKSSLALSLGLVGALSIVRFRAAIKEPEELSFLFISIGIGLGLGADQVKISLIAFMVICGVLILRGLFYNRRKFESNLFITITALSGKIGLKEITDVLKDYCRVVVLKRLDESKNNIETSFLVEFINFESLDLGKQAIRELDESVEFSLVETTEIPV